MGRASLSFLLAAIAVIMPSIPVYAQAAAGKTAQSTFDRCLNTGDARMGVMPAIFDCYRQELSRKDKQLNITYRAVRKNLTPAKQRELQVLERGWIAQRDKTCKAEADGSQDGQISWYGCLLQETERRIAWLKDFARKA